jgi:general L-amino acid transport system permease protein
MQTLPSSNVGVAAWWYDRTARAIAFQAALLFVVVAAAIFFFSNVQTNMAARGLTLGFGFLDRSAGIPIGEYLIPYTPSNSYARALTVGLLNTLRVAVIGCLLVTLLGVFLGILRLSENPLLSGLVGVYIEIVRNTPVVLQLVFWLVVFQQLPSVREALNPLPGVYLSQRGLKIPVLEWNDAAIFALAGLAVAIAMIGWTVRRARAHQMQTGEYRRVWPICLGYLVLLPLAAAQLTGDRLILSVPELQGFNFAGGAELSPEFAALLTGLVIYTAAFVAEIVRSGIQSVGKGQWEASRALGLSNGRIMRLVILPQALRVIVPPLTSQYLNLTKNSSLAIVIGYQDLFSVSNTSINQTGQAIEVIFIMMTVYLVLSLLTAAGMNIYNARVALKER